MRKSLLVVSSMLILAVGAADRDQRNPAPRLAYDVSVFTDMSHSLGKAQARVHTTASATTYPPCRPGRGDDRCIQMYERAVRLAYQRTEPAEPRPATSTRRGTARPVAVGGPLERVTPQRRARPAMVQPSRARPAQPSQPRDEPGSTPGI
jgi:hypothetical protein